MMPLAFEDQTPVAPPSSHRGQARLGPALHMNALTLVTTLHLLALCRLAVRLAHRRCPPPLPAGKGGSPRTYSEESLLLIGLLRTLWRLSYQDMHDWLKSWPALALACGLSAWTRPTGACVSLPGFMRCLVLSPSFRGIPSVRRIAPACLQPGRKKNSGNEAALSASLDACFSFFISNVHLCVAGPRLPRR